MPTSVNVLFLRILLTWFKELKETQFFIGQEPSTWPVNNCRQKMVCSCVLLQITKSCFLRFWRKINAHSQMTLGSDVYFCLNIPQEGRKRVFSWCVISWFYFPWNVNLGNYSSWLVTWRFCVNREGPGFLTDILRYVICNMESWPSHSRFCFSSVRPGH